jgi:hypothetical protein
MSQPAGSGATLYLAQSMGSGADSVHGLSVQLFLRRKHPPSRWKTHGVFSWPVEHRE